MAGNQRAGLTRQTMIEAALRLLDDVGLDGLTVRRLARDLGVQSPALYWHIRSKQELLDGMAEAIVQAAGMGPPRDGETWQDWLARRARGYRRSLLAHPDGARIVATGSRVGPETLRTFDQELTAMVGSGFSPLLALRTITAVSQFTTGFVLQEQTERRVDPDTPLDDQLAALAGLLDGGTSATLFLALGAGESQLGERAFEHGLRALIDGTAAALARERAGAAD